MSEVEWKGEPVELSTDEEHALVVHTVELVLVDDFGEPRTGERCRLTGPGGFVAEAVTDGEGEARFIVPPGAELELSYPDLEDGSWLTSEEYDARVQADEEKYEREQAARADAEYEAEIEHE